MATIDMSKTHRKYDMTKEDGSPIELIFIGARWDKNRFAGGDEADLDVSSFVTEANRKVCYPTDIVNYATWESQGAAAYPWCQFSGDNRDGDDSKGGIDFNGKHYDEYFIIDASKFPANRTEMTICLSIFRAVQRAQSFGVVTNANIDIYDYNNPTGKNWTYNLTDNPKFEDLNAVEIGRLLRRGNGFTFQPIGSGYFGGMTELFKNFGLDIDEGRD